VVNASRPSTRFSVRRVGRRHPLLIAVGLVVILGLSPLGLVGSTPGVAQNTAMTAFDTHIDHIVLLTQENRAYDNYYGLYCPKISTYCSSVGDGIPPGTCIPKAPAHPSQGCIRPFNLTKIIYQIPDMPHGWNSTHEAWNNGSMNGFYAAEGRVLSLGHYTSSEIPVYYDLAEQYGLADDFFSSAATYSLPNHWYEWGSSSPSIANVIMPENDPSAPVKHLYLNESNATPTLEDQLINSSVSWKYYDYSLAPYTNAIQTKSPAGNAYNLWNPLAARAQSYATSVRSHFVDRSDFFSDAANGTLPSLSWIIPSTADSDHPPADVRAGQSWVASVVDALEASPEWNTTLLLVTWDEYGGFYDHVAPPVLDAEGDGFRVPLLMIGPWVRQGFIDHAQMDLGSILHLMESRFGFTCLGARDCNATLPLAAFNFSRPGPRAPILIGTYGNATYPMPLQSSGKLPPFDPDQIPAPQGMNATVLFAPGWGG
jgi:phospholipase C